MIEEDLQAFPAHLFGLFLGSQVVARSILQAASIHLTPVTLELGGKCPCLIYGRVNVTAAARRLVWAKFFNAGQSCVAPDYVLCSQATLSALLPALRKALEDFYGKEPHTSPDLARIVSHQHWTRLVDLLGKSSGKVVVGGESNRDDKYIGGLRTKKSSTTLSNVYSHLGHLGNEYL